MEDGEVLFMPVTRRSEVTVAEVRGEGVEGVGLEGLPSGEAFKGLSPKSAVLEVHLVSRRCPRRRRRSRRCRRCRRRRQGSRGSARSRTSSLRSGLAARSGQAGEGVKHGAEERAEVGDDRSEVRVLVVEVEEVGVAHLAPEGRAGEEGSLEAVTAWRSKRSMVEGAPVARKHGVHGRRRMPEVQGEGGRLGDELVLDEEANFLLVVDEVEDGSEAHVKLPDEDGVRVEAGSLAGDRSVDRRGEVREVPAEEADLLVVVVGEKCVVREGHRDEEEGVLVEVLPEVRRVNVAEEVDGHLNGEEGRPVEVQEEVARTARSLVQEERTGLLEAHEVGPGNRHEERAAERRVPEGLGALANHRGLVKENLVQVVGEARGSVLKALVAGSQDEVHELLAGSRVVRREVEEVVLEVHLRELLLEGVVVEARRSAAPGRRCGSRRSRASRNLRSGEGHPEAQRRRRG